MVVNRLFWGITGGNQSSPAISGNRVRGWPGVPDPFKTVRHSRHDQLFDR
jgi:hypothetical protein